MSIRIFSKDTLIDTYKYADLAKTSYFNNVIEEFLEQNSLSSDDEYSMDFVIGDFAPQNIIKVVCDSLRDNVEEYTIRKLLTKLSSEAKAIVYLNYFDITSINTKNLRFVKNHLGKIYKVIYGIETINDTMYLNLGYDQNGVTEYVSAKSASNINSYAIATGHIAKLGKFDGKEMIYAQEKFFPTTSIVVEGTLFLPARDFIKTVHWFYADDYKEFFERQSVQKIRLVRR